MKITEKNITGELLVNIDWLRTKTPYTDDNISKQIDSVEFEINHKGIEKLSRNIENEEEYIMCFVHFDAGTENLDGIYLSVWGKETEDNIDTMILEDDEKQILVTCALQKLKEYREN